MKTVLITGASGFLGHHLVQELLKQDDTEVIAILGRAEGKANALPSNSNLKVFTLNALYDESFSEIETVVNCAFARSNDAKLLAGAFDFTERSIKRFEELGVKSVINISSQGVYQRLGAGELSTEDSPIEPIDQYSMAKYATEKMFNLSSIPYVTNVRLSSLNMPQRFLSFFVDNIRNGKPIILTSPNSQASLLDVRDAAKAIKSLIMLPFEKRSEIYNLGIGRQYTILEYANMVKSIGEKHGYTPSIIIEDNGNVTNSGMDCSKIKQDCNWEVEISPEIMIERLFLNFKNNKNE